MACLGEELELWGRLRESNDRAAHQLLFAKYSAWARSVAGDVFRRVKIAQMDWADYSQNAVIGLLEAMERFDHARGIDFIAYAKPRVRGSVFNGLRMFLAENRQAGAWQGRREDRLDSLNERDGADQLDHFVSLVSGLAIGHFLDVIGESDFVDQMQPVERQIDVDRVGGRLREAIRKLPEKEGQVIGLHYLQHIPFVEIARLLGVTKGRISQLHKSGIARLRSSPLLDGFRGAV